MFLYEYIKSDTNCGSVDATRFSLLVGQRMEQIQQRCGSMNLLRDG